MCKAAKGLYDEWRDGAFSSDPEVQKNRHLKDGSTGLGIRNAAEVPLGAGLADAAKVAIMTRRERLRIAEEGR